MFKFQENQIKVWYLALKIILIEITLDLVRYLILTLRRLNIRYPIKTVDPSFRESLKIRFHFRLGYFI